MNQRLRKSIRLCMGLLALLMTQGAWAQVVISQVYGGGGNTGSTYRNDFIELFNRGTTPVTITGWTVQYASAAGATWATTSLSGTIAPGGYYLIQEAAGTGGTTDLPTPNAIGMLALSGTAGKIALVNVTTALSGTCPTGATLIDFVGFGATANCFEGTGPTPAPSNTTAILRASSGCTDANQNATDFTTGAPNPRNSSSPINSCGPVTPVATLSATPTTLTGFAATQGTASNVQTYTLTGSTLDGNPVSVSATANVELSTSAGGAFAPTLSLPASASTISQVVYVRLTSAAPTGAFSGTITNTANGTLTASVTVSGQVNAVNAPLLSASPTTLSGFTATQGMTSAAQTYSLTATNLGGQVITIQAPAGFEIGIATSTPTYSSTLSVTPTSNNTTYPLISVRLTSGTFIGPVSGTITNIAGSLTANVAVSGSVSSTAPVGPYTPIATARAGINSTFTIQGRVTVSNQLGGRQIYIQDETGGIAVYSGPSGPDFSTLVNIGDLVQVRGPVTVFSGYLELTGTGNFTVVAGAGTVVPAPIAITPDQLASYQGRLVSVANATITPTAATFTGGTSYTITAGGASGILRISANSPLAGAGQPANPVSVTGIADRFVSGATTTGTNGLQLQPRILADIPGSTPAMDVTCTIGSGSPLTRDQTLDIAAWNFEFFGADAGVISCPSGTTLAYENFGPTNEALQQTNATSVVSKLNADIISAEEVSDINRFAAAVQAIPGSYSYICSNRFSYYFQNECDQTPSGNPPVVFGPTRLAQKVCVIYNTATVTPVLAETKALLDGKYNYPSANNWSSGRLPFLFVANVTIGGITQKIHVVALHAKSGSATADYNRRKQDILDLKAELDANYSTANVVILGDYNDKLNGSIAAGQQSSYQPFVTDAVNYSAVTLPLENQGCSTFNSSASFIDHIITSNELAKAYVANSVYVLQPFSIPNYGNTTSDHNPVEARFDLNQFVSVPTPVITVTPSTLNSYLYTTQSASSASQSYTVSATNLPASLTITAPARYFISLGSSTTFSQQLVLPATNGTVLPTRVNVILSTSSAGTYAGNVTNVSGSATATVAVSGTVLQATLTATPTTLSGFTTTVGTPSAIQMYTVTTLNQTGITVVAPSGVQIRTGSNPFSSSLTIGFSYSTVSIPVDVRLSGLTSGPVTGTITHQSAFGSADLSAIVAINGVVTAAPPVNQAPVVANTIPAQTATVGQGFSYVIPATTFSDPNNDMLTLSVSGLPVGLSFTAPATISGTPSTTGTSTVTVTATDPGSLSASTSFTLTVSPVTSVTSAAPFSITGVTTVSCTTVSAGQRSLTFNPQYAGLSGSPVSFSVANELAPTTNPGPYTLTLYTDNPVITLRAVQSGVVSSFAYNWLAACNGNTTPPVNQAPVVANPIPAQTATVGQGFNYMIPATTFSDPNNDVLTLSVSGLPAGLSFVAPATISGTPSATGTSTITVKATDPGSLSASTSFTLTVSPATSVTSAAPFSITGVTTVSCTTVSAGQRSLTFNPQYAGLSGSPVSFSVANELAPTTNPGPYTLTLYTDNPVITLRAVQSGVVSSFAYNWLAACNGNTTPPVNQAPVVANPIPAQTATVGQGFNYMIPATTFSDPNNDVLTLSVSGLPAGLSFVAPATISGTPSATGTSTITVKATDPGSLSASTSFTLTVSPATSVTSAAPFSITGVTTVSCTTVSAGQRSLTFNPQYAGLTGSVVSFSVVNELAPTTNPGPYTLSLFIDNPVITLRAVQNGVQTSFSYNWLAACNSGSARTGAELLPTLKATLYPNPVGNEFLVRIEGAQGKTVQLLLTNVSGHTLMTKSVAIDLSSHQEKIQFNQHQTGLYLLRVSTGKETVTLKVIKQ